MLTSDQLSQFESLIKDPKFGKLLKAAIRNWKKFKPAQGNTGLLQWKKEEGDCLYYKRNKTVSGCCLIGAAMYGAKINTSLMKDCKEKFKINEGDITALIDGFDGYRNSYNREANNFACNVRMILFGK